MAKILKLNEISAVADKYLPKSYEFSKEVVNPDGIMLRSFNMHEYPLDSNLLAIARAGAGTNNIPIDKCSEKGIVVFNTPGANANAVKELVLCELFLGGRKIVDAIEWVKTLKGKEDVAKLVEKGKGNFVGGEILGKKLGVIGLGAIGIRVANAANELGMEVLGYDPYISVEGAWTLSREIKRVLDVKEIFADCDFITVHVPLTAENKHMFNAESIATMKDGVVIVNNSRGELVDNAAIVAAAESGKVGRYITDFPANELIGAKNVICVPHLGASTPEAEDNCAMMAAQEISEYIENGNILHSVNFPDVNVPFNAASRISVFHKNIPGRISAITSLVTAHDINIATCTDKSKGENAYLILDLDHKPDDSLISDIAKVEGVVRVRIVK